jgi:non-ribosomal peptide synthetase component F
MVLLAGFQALLSRYTGEREVAVGTAVAGRGRAELEGLIGFFVNTLVLRVDLSGDPTFIELVGRVREVCLGAYAHEDVPFDRIVEELAPERTLSRSPLFQVAFGLQNAPVQTLELKGLRLSPLAYENEAGRYDLTLWMSESAGGLLGKVTYNRDLYDEEIVEALGRHYARLLQSVAADPEAKVSKLQMLTDEELQAQRQAESASAASAYQKFVSARPAKVVSLSPDAPPAEERHG